MRKLTVAFHNFANASINVTNISESNIAYYTKVSLTEYFIMAKLQEEFCLPDDVTVA